MSGQLGDKPYVAAELPSSAGESAYRAVRVFGCPTCGRPVEVGSLLVRAEFEPMHCEACNAEAAALRISAAHPNHEWTRDTTAGQGWTLQPVTQLELPIDAAADDQSLYAASDIASGGSPTESEHS